MEEEKMKEVLEWPTSNGVKNIQKFLGLANCYQWFIKDFASIARLLYKRIRNRIRQRSMRGHLGS